MLPCMDSLNLSGLTYRLTGLPCTSWLRVESLWQAKQSSLVGFGAAGFAAAGFVAAMVAVAASSSNATVILVLSPAQRNIAFMALIAFPHPPAGSFGQPHCSWRRAIAAMRLLTGSCDLSHKADVQKVTWGNGRKSQANPGWERRHNKNSRKGRALLNAEGAGPACTPQADGSNTIVSGVQILAQQVDNLQARLAVFTQEAQKVFTLDGGDLRVIEQLRSHLVRCAREGGTQSQDLPGPRDTKNHSSSGLGTNGKFCAAFTQNENTARSTALPKQGRATRKDRQSLQRIEVLQGLVRKVAEQPFRPLHALQATSVNGTFHSSGIAQWRMKNSDCSHR